MVALLPDYFSTPILVSCTTAIQSKLEMETAWKQVVAICDEDGEHSAAEQENLHCQAVGCQCVRPQSASHESANHTTPQDQSMFPHKSVMDIR